MSPTRSEHRARATRRAFPLPHTGLPGLDELINGDLWQRWSDRNTVFPLGDFRDAVRYVRLKPGTSCRLAVFGNDAGTVGEPPPGFLLYLFADVDRARQAFRKVTSRPLLVGPAGHQAFLCERSATMGIPFPNDPKIPGLRHAYRPSRLRRALAVMLPEFGEDRVRMIRRGTAALDLLGYKPERRAVYRLVARTRGDGGPLRLHVKLENPATAERSFANLTAIHRALPACTEWRVPRPRGAVVDRSMMAAEWIDGRSLQDRPGGTGIPADVLERAGRALGGLHGLDVSLPPLANPLHESDRLRALGRDLAALLPDQEAPIVELAERLAGQWLAQPSTRPCVSHGDFHLGQVLESEDGIVLVDLDRAGCGSPVADLGSFVAHLEESGGGPESREAFLAGHAAAAGWQPDPEALRIVTACSIFRRSIFPFRLLEADWPAEIRRRLDRVARLAEPVRL